MFNFDLFGLLCYTENNFKKQNKIKYLIKIKKSKQMFDFIKNMLYNEITFKILPLFLVWYNTTKILPLSLN